MAGCPRRSLLAEGTSWRAAAGEPLSDGAEIDLVVRPEGLSVSAAGGPGSLAGQVAEKRFAGRVAYFEVVLASGGSLEVLAPPEAAAIGDKVFVQAAPGAPLPWAYRREAGG